MPLRYLGALTITAATPKKLSVVFPNEKGVPFHTLIVAQKRGNAGFVYVGDSAMTGEANASFTIPPASASSCPFVATSVESPPGALTVDCFAIDGSANETVQISVITT